MVAAQPALRELGVSDEELQDSVYQSVVGNYLILPSPGDQIRALPVARRSAVLLSAGALAKAYLVSEPFRRRYTAELAGGRLGLQLPAPARTYATYLQDEAARLDRELAESRLKLPLLTTITRNQLIRQIDEVERGRREQLRELAAVSAEDRRNWEQNDRERFGRESADYDEAVAKGRALPAAPDALVRLRLHQFLAQTTDVDFAAVLTPGKRFARADYEGKPLLWKACYRAGPLTTEAARGFAQSWLRELPT